MIKLIINVLMMLHLAYCTSQERECLDLIFLKLEFWELGVTFGKIPNQHGISFLKESSNGKLAWGSQGKDTEELLGVMYSN